MGMSSKFTCISEGKKGMSFKFTQQFLFIFLLVYNSNIDFRITFSLFSLILVRA